MNLKKLLLKIINFELRLQLFHFFKSDIRYTNLVELVKPDLVCHLAAMAGVRNSLDKPVSYTDINISDNCDV